MTEDQKEEYQKLCKDAGEVQYAIKLSEAMLMKINERIFQIIGEAPLKGEDPTQPKLFVPGGSN